jgi:hypothetical protein
VLSPARFETVTVDGSGAELELLGAVAQKAQMVG